VCESGRGRKIEDKCDIDKRHERHLTKRRVTVHEAKGETAGGGEEDAA